ncbi:MAG TPA: hypothetical protein VFS88_02360, partial [Micavibrio sp.]|nr:hypothetical protein [Micavibrio sp.]
DLKALRKIPRIGYYFRYDLHRGNFYEIKIKDRLYGHYTAKPLYGRLTPEGRVDKSAGFDGDVAALFIPLEAHAQQDARLFVTHTDPAKLVLANGKKNWKAINKVAESFIKRKIAKG